MSDGRVVPVETVSLAGGGVRVNVNVNVVVRGRSGLAGAGVSGITFVITKLVFLFTVSV